MGKGGGGTNTVVEQTGPPEWMVPYLQGGLEQAQNTYNQYGLFNPQAYPGQTVANPSDLENLALGYFGQNMLGGELNQAGQSWAMQNLTNPQVYIPQTGNSWQQYMGGFETPQINSNWQQFYQPNVTAPSVPNEWQQYANYSAQVPQIDNSFLSYANQSFNVPTIAKDFDKYMFNVNTPTIDNSAWQQYYNDQIPVQLSPYIDELVTQ